MNNETIKQLKRIMVEHDLNAGEVNAIKSVIDFYNLYCKRVEMIERLTPVDVMKKLNNERIAAFSWTKSDIYGILTSGRKGG